MRVQRLDDGTVRYAHHTNRTQLAVQLSGTALIVSLSAMHATVVPSTLLLAPMTYECSGLNGSSIAEATFDSVRLFRAHALSDK